MSEFEPIICIDGVFNASVSPLDRGLAYGDGLFETCRVSDGRILLWELHLDRLQKSGKRLGLPINLDSLLTQRNQMLKELLRQGHADGVLKLMVTRGTGGRGYKPPVHPKPMLCWIFYPGVKPQWTQGALDGVNVWMCQQRLSDNPALAGMKHLSRLDYVLARAEWGDEYAEGLLLDDQGRVVEGIISNVFTVSDGRLLTPTLRRSGVEGVMRRMIMERLASRLALAVASEDTTLTQLQKADEVFVCNSVFGIWPVTGLVQPETDGISKSIGPVTRGLQQAWADWLMEAGR